MYIMLLHTQLISGAVLILVLVSVIFIVSKKSVPSFNKAIPFECGFIPLLNSRMPFSVQFFLISLVFLVFDVELILLFPILVSQLNLLILSVSGFALFMILMTAGLIWEWSQGSLEWLK